MRLFKIILVGLFCATSNVAHSMVNIFACEPEWESLAKEIGGGKVKTFSATHAMQNPHYIRARPSLINKAVKMIEKRYVVGDNPLWYELDDVESIDIDTEFDYMVAELLYEFGQKYRYIKEKFKGK